MTSRFNFPGFRDAIGVEPVGQGRAWVCSSGKMKLLDTTGRTFMDITIDPESFPVTSDKEGNCLVSSYLGETIKRVTKQGTTATLLSNFHDKPQGMAFRQEADGSKKLFVCFTDQSHPKDCKGGYVKVFTFSSSPDEIKGKTFCASRKCPLRIAADPKSDLACLSDFGDKAVTMHRSDGEKVAEYREGAKSAFRPYGVCFDNEGCIIVANYSGNSVIRLSRAGTMLQVLLKNKLRPQSVSVDENNLLWLGLESREVFVYQIRETK